jgi:hypothetical protein
MGLYDSYKLSNSQGVPQYQGGLSDIVSKAQPALMDRYEKVAAAIPAFNQALDTLPYMAQDKDNWLKLKQETNDKMGEWSQRKDLGNLTMDVDRFSKKTSRTMALLTKEQAKEQAYQTLLADKEYDLTPNQKKAYKIEAHENYKGLEFDEYGRATNGFVGRTPAKRVSNIDKTKKVISELLPNKTSQEIRNTNGEWEVFESGSWSTIKDPRIAAAVANGINMDPEWKASLEQDAWAEAKLRTQGISNEAILQELEQPTTSPAQLANNEQIRKGIASGLTAKQALEAVQTNSIYNTNNERIYNWALSKQVDDNSYKLDIGYDELAKEDALRDIKLEDDAAAKEENLGISSITLPSENFDFKESFKDLSSQEKELTEQITQWRGAASQWIKLDAEGQPVMVDGKYVPIGNRSLSNAPANVLEAIESLNQGVPNLKALNNQSKHILDEAAAAHNPNLRTSDGNSKGAYDRLEDSWSAELVKVLKDYDKADKFTVIPLKGQSTIEDANEKLIDRNIPMAGTKKAITLTDLRTAAAEGRVKEGYNPSTSTPFYTVYNKQGKAVYEVPFSPGQHNFHVPGGKDFLEKQRTQRADIRVNAASNYKEFSSNYSSVAPALAIDLTNKESKNIGHDLISAISSNRGAVTIQNSEGKTFDKDELNEQMISKATSLSVHKRGNNVVVNIVIPSDAKNEERIIKVTLPATSNASKMLYNYATKSTDPGIRESAMTFNPGSQIPELQKMQVGKDVKVNGANLFYEMIKSGNKSYYKIYTKTANGKRYLRNNEVNPDSGDDAPFSTDRPTYAELQVIEQLKMLKDGKRP